MRASVAPRRIQIKYSGGQSDSRTLVRQLIPIFISDIFIWYQKEILCLITVFRAPMHLKTIFYLHKLLKYRDTHEISSEYEFITKNYKQNTQELLK